MEMKQIPFSTGKHKPKRIRSCVADKLLCWIATKYIDLSPLSNTNMI